MKLSEIIQRIITLATARQAHEAEWFERHFPGRLAVSFAELATAPQEPAAEVAELRQFLLSLPVAAIYAIEFVMYLGRGDFDPEEFHERYFEMSDQRVKPESDVGHMLGKLPLGDYLADGLLRLSEANIDIDRLLDM